MGKTLKIILIITGSLFALGIITTVGVGAYIWYRVIPYELRVEFRAEQLSSQGKYDEVLKLYEDILKEDPDSAYAWNRKGEVLHNLGKYEKALAAFEKGLDCVGKDIAQGNTWGTTFQSCSLWTNKGKALTELEKYDEAITCYDKALELYPDNVEIYIAKGITLNKEKKYDEAITVYDRGAELLTESGWGWESKAHSLWTNRGLAFKELGNYQEAINSFNLALRAIPDAEDTIKYRDETLEEMKGI